VIDPAKPPNGSQLVQILLENQDLKIKDTPCRSNADDKRTVRHKLAAILGESLDSLALRSVIKGRCEPVQVKSAAGTQDLWDCQLTVLEVNEQWEDVTSASIFFGITQDTWKIIPANFRCT
jgi:hypothetical protein